MPVYIDEFLYRGRKPGDATPPAWQLLIGRIGRDENDNEITLQSTMLNMQQASEAGFPLPTIIEAINAEILREVETLRTEKQQLAEALETSTQKAEALENLVNAMQANLPAEGSQEQNADPT